MTKKVVLVSGVSSGLGLAACGKLLAHGYRVIGFSRRLSPGIEDMAEQYKGDLTFYPFDLADVANISPFVRSLGREHGRIYGLVNNAALAHEGVLATMHENDIENLIVINVQAAILLTKYVIRNMLLGKSGRIINVGSIIGSTGFNGLSVYGATKAAMEGFSRSLAREVGKAGITVNTLAPGYMETNMTAGMQNSSLDAVRRRSPMGKLASVSDAADSIIFLLSDEAKSITGSTLTVDAGSTA